MKLELICALEDKIRSMQVVTLVEAANRSIWKPSNPLLQWLGEEAGIHEIVACDYGHDLAAAGFVCGLLRLLKDQTGCLLWIVSDRTRRDLGRLCGRGLVALGIDPGRVLFVRAGRVSDCLWALETGLKSRAVSAVVGEVDDADFTQSRRLSMASATYGVPAFLLMPHSREGVSSAQSRWRIAPQSSGINPWYSSAPGVLRWSAILERSRACSSKTGHCFELEWDHEADGLCLVQRLVPRSVAPNFQKKTTFGRP